MPSTVLCIVRRIEKKNLEFDVDNEILLQRSETYNLFEKRQTLSRPTSQNDFPFLCFFVFNF